MSLEDLVNQPHEIIIDGFAILSFRTKDELLRYSEKFDVAQSKVSLTNDSSKKCTRSRPTGSATKKRVKGHESQMMSDVAPPVDVNSRNGSLASDAYADHPHSNTSPPTHIQSHSNGSSQLDNESSAFNSNSSSHVSSFRISDHRHNRLPKEGHALRDSDNYGDNFQSRPNSRSSLSTPSSTRSQRIEEDKLSRSSSYTDTVLTTTLDCHLTPLSTTWNDRVSHPEILTSQHPASNQFEQKDSRRTLVPNKNDVHTVQFSTPENAQKSKPCLDFSVAALTDESANRKSTTPENLHTAPAVIKSPPQLELRQPLNRDMHRRIEYRSNDQKSEIVTPSAPQLVAFNSGTTTSVPSLTGPAILDSVSTSNVVRKRLTNPPSSNGTANSSVSVTTSRCPPSSPCLERLVGMDTDTATRLFNSARFDEVYSLTLAALASAEAKARKRGAQTSENNSEVKNTAHLASPTRSSVAFNAGGSSRASNQPLTNSPLKRAPGGQSHSFATTSVPNPTTAVSGSIDMSTTNLRHGINNNRKFVTPGPGVDSCNNFAPPPYPLTTPNLPPVLPPPTFPRGLPSGPPLSKSLGMDLSSSAVNGQGASPRPSDLSTSFVARHRYAHSEQLKAVNKVRAPLHPNPAACPPSSMSFQDVFTSELQKQWAAVLQSKGIETHPDNASEYANFVNHMLSSMGRTTNPNAPYNPGFPAMVPSPRMPANGNQHPLIHHPRSQCSSTSVPLPSGPRGSNSSSNTSVLWRRIHPKHTCGRWADAHVRIAHYIRHCRFKSEPLSRRDGVKISQSTHTAASVLRPAVHCSRTKAAETNHLGLTVPLSNPSSLSLGAPAQSILSSNVPASAAQAIPNIVPNNRSTADLFLEKNAFLHHFMEGLFSDASAKLQSNGQLSPREPIELLWQSALRNAQLNSAHSPPSILQQHPQIQNNVLPSHGEGKWTFPPVSSLGHLTGTNSSNLYPKYHTEPPGPNNMSSVDAKRRRVEHPALLQHQPPNANFNAPNIPSLPSLEPRFRMHANPRQSVPGSDMFAAAVQMLNGYRFPEMYPSHHATPVRQGADYRSSLGPGLKSDPRTSSLAPVRPW